MRRKRDKAWRLLPVNTYWQGACAVPPSPLFHPWPTSTSIQPLPVVFNGYNSSLSRMAQDSSTVLETDLRWRQISAHNLRAQWCTNRLIWPIYKVLLERSRNKLALLRSQRHGPTFSWFGLKSISDLYYEKRSSKLGNLGHMAAGEKIITRVESCSIQKIGFYLLTNVLNTGWNILPPTPVLDKIQNLKFRALYESSLPFLLRTSNIQTHSV